MSDRLRKRLENKSPQQLDDQLKRISQYSREQRFVSPYINQPEKTELLGKTIIDAPRKREADPLMQGLFRGFTAPVMQAREELQQSGDAFKEGNIGSGIADLLKGSLHTAMSPITAPLGAVTEGLKGTGEVGEEVAKGIEQTFDLPFAAIRYGSETVKDAFEIAGKDLSDNETTAKYNELIQEVAGLYALGKTHTSVKKYIDKKLPEIKQLPKEPEVVIKPLENKPVGGLTQETLPSDLIKPKESPVIENVEKPLSRAERINQKNIDSIKEEAIKIMTDDPSLTSMPRKIVGKLNALKNEGKIKGNFNSENVMNWAKEFNEARKKKITEQKTVTFKETPIEEIDMPGFYGKNTTTTVGAVLKKNPEFKPFIEGLTKPEDISGALFKLAADYRGGKPLEIPDIQIQKTIERAGGRYEGIKGNDFQFTNTKTGGTFTLNRNEITEAKLNEIFANDKIKPLEGELPKKATQEELTKAVDETRTSIKNRIVNQERVDRGLSPLETTMKREWGEVWEDAKKKIESKEVDPVKLADELSKNPRPTTDTEGAILTYERERVKQERTKITKEISEITDPTIRAEKVKESLLLDEQYNTLDVAGKQSGTETARGLAIRRMEIKDDYSIAPVIQRARVANKDVAIPDDLRIKLEDYSQKIAEGETKVKALEEQLSKSEAEKLVLENQFEQRTSRRESKKINLDTEYESLVKEFAKTTQFNMLVDPKQIEILSKIAKNRVKKGVTNVNQLVDSIYQDIKQYLPELTRQDVMDAIGGVGKFQKMSESDIRVELKDIRKRVSDETLQKTYKTRLENRKAELEKKLETGDYEKTPRRKTKMNPELSALKDEVDLLKIKVDKEIRLLERKNRKPIGVAEDFAIELGNIPRTLMSSVDLSAPLRQGVIYSASHPIITFGKGGAFREMFGYFKSDKALRELKREIEESPNAVLYNKSGLYLANEKTNLGRVSGREEAYMSSLPEKIPGLGRLVRSSERAYTGFLDKLRMDMFDFYTENLQKSGVTFESNPKAYKDMGKMINSSTGRGTLGGFERSASALSLGLFSPRLIASRLQLINPRYYLKLEPQVRKMAMKDMLKFVSVGTSIVSLAKLAGAEVELDPRSSDFGKIKMGDTRLDVWGGFQQYGAFFTRLATAQTKTVGKVKELDGKKFPFTTREDLIIRFAEQKGSPIATFLVDYFRGKDFEGKEFELSNALVDRLIPLYMKDMTEAIKEDGIEGAFKTMPGIFGVGTQTYKPKRTKKQN
jgi:hypothetical protein